MLKCYTNDFWMIVYYSIDCWMNLDKLDECMIGCSSWNLDFDAMDGSTNLLIRIQRNLEEKLLEWWWRDLESFSSIQQSVVVGITRSSREK